MVFRARDLERREREKLGRRLVKERGIGLSAANQFVPQPANSHSFDSRNFSTTHNTTNSHNTYNSYNSYTVNEKNNFFAICGVLDFGNLDDDLFDDFDDYYGGNGAIKW